MGEHVLQGFIVEAIEEADSPEQVNHEVKSVHSPPVEFFVVWPQIDLLTRHVIRKQAAVEEGRIQVDSQHKQRWVICVALETFFVVVLEDHLEEIEDGLLVFHDHLVGFQSFVELAILTVG